MWVRKFPHRPPSPVPASHTEPPPPQVFSDLAEIVESQGESVNVIESDIEAAHSNTTQGMTQLEKATKHQKSGFRCCLIALVAIACVMVIVVVAMVVGAQVAL